ncbi:hypothetical protein EV363DRAFT_1329084 [Boletus edulis]|uniref:Uncharacterized protein n=1 Tax=Boletus edulis BED1 TaxID=1328754 RepID=A0AAD4C070_BOLED|nr:hypothetical protein EV363DRAFT_1350517 [Boletus edulis]KAF8132603.1 hypothetical protein EV363DRAFT_1329084 [Boletus edulis]KAF8416123.1 hypothetical protein L210DRAFT_3583502 [Boletus edulis BED1]KAF8444088.1 hypothetical protein L210DRAFT_3533774 [Boletus edulis BED1]
MAWDIRPGVRPLATDHTAYVLSILSVHVYLLVTGSAHGIGRGIIFRLARDWFDIAPNDASSQRDQLRAVVDDI